MKDIYTITIVGFVIGIVGTGFGGLLSTFIKTTNDKLVSNLLGLTGGFMLGIVTFKLLPESYLLGGIWIELFGVILGMILILVVEKLVPKKNTSPMLRSGIIFGISIGIHNLPEGLAVGSAFMANESIGLSLSIAMVVHNIPEGLAMAIPLKLTGLPWWKILLLTIVAAFPTGLGAFMGAYLGNISNLYIAICLSLAGGTMLYIVCDEIIPNAKTRGKGSSSTVSLIIGFVLGLFF